MPYARLFLLAPQSSLDMKKLTLGADTLLAKVPENYEKPKQLDWYDSNRNAVRHGEVRKSGLTGVTRNHVRRHPFPNKIADLATCRQAHICHQYADSAR